MIFAEARKFKNDLIDAPIIEWSVAGVLCGFGFIVSYCLIMFRVKAQVEYPNHSFFRTGRFFSTVRVGLVWCLILVVLGVFPAMVSMYLYLL